MMNPTMDDTLIYLYGFVSADTPEPPADLAGVGDRPIRIVAQNGFGAAIGTVPRSEYGEDVLEERLRNLEWVADQGGRHERVVTWFVDHGQILPVRLLSLYSSEATLEAEAADGRDRILEELERLEGLREWNLKVSYDQEALEERLGEVSEEIGRLDAAIQDARPGKGYLLTRKRKDEARTRTREAARRLAEDLLERARALAVETDTLPPPERAATLPVVLNAALLVPAERDDELRELLEERSGELEEFGLEIRYSGPWAPYRFVRGGDGE